MADDKITINRIGAETVAVPIIGTAPLIMHRWSEKAKRLLLDNMQGRKSPREYKDPQAEYEAAFYRIKEGTDSYGFPALGFKSATVGGCRFYGKDVSMVAMRQCLFFSGEQGADGQQLMPIKGEPQMREDVVRPSAGGADLRYRPMFVEWSSTLLVTYVTAMINRNSVLSLIDAGGMGVGVGEWRPEKKGEFGTYAIDTTRDVEVVS